MLATQKNSRKQKRTTRAYGGTAGTRARIDTKVCEHERTSKQDNARHERARKTVRTRAHIAEALRTTRAYGQNEAGN